MSGRRMVAAFQLALVVSLLTIGVAGSAAERSWRFDCGPAGSQVMAGYRLLTGDEMYSPEKGYGWEGKTPTAVDFSKTFDFRALEMFKQHAMDNLNPLNSDAVLSENDLAFRADVPNGTYRVTVTIGDMTHVIGSIDVYMNGVRISEHVAAWRPGGHGGGGHHRRILQVPDGWWTNERATVAVKDGSIQIVLTKNQEYYDTMAAKQAVEETAWENAIAAAGDVPPYTRVGVTKPPYYYIGWPFVHNSVNSIEIVPDVPALVAGENDKLTLTGDIDSPALKQAISLFNQKDFGAALSALDRVSEPQAQAAKAIVQLWLVGRLETELELDQGLVRSALAVLRPYAQSHPEENRVAEILTDAEMFDKALDAHLTRGEAAKGENHFAENDKAIGWWWTIHEGTPLYYKAQLYTARAEHMLIPYFPARGTYREILKKLEQKFPDNRFVKYQLHEEWAPHGDGSKYYDWFKVDYAQAVADSPEWVRQLFPAFQTTLDWCEWWIKWKQQPEGSIGGGWGDDVEIVGAFGYMGYTSRGMSDLLVNGTAKLVDGLWKFSEVDPEIGYCLPMGDAEHTAEWTGNTLGMMAQIDHGNPTWVERSMKTAKLMRDLWTDYNKNGHRHFRANYFNAAQVGSGDQRNDSWINYRAIRPAAAVLSYNHNPAIRDLYVELADGWLASAMSTDRGKPRGVIPAEISFPDGLIGGINSPNWYTASHPEGTGNADWIDQGYKPYVQDLLLIAYRTTGEPKYLEPLRLEYELAAKYGYLPEIKTGARLQAVTYPEVFGKRDRSPMLRQVTAPKTGETAQALVATPEPGSEEWAARNVEAVNAWLVGKRAAEGRTGELQDELMKEDIIRASMRSSSELSWGWPIRTTEAGPTDRVAFVGLVNPFLIYTGGWIGGALLEAAITYDNTTRDFAAAVVASDSQGFRILYYSLTPDTRTVGVVPWHLEPGSSYHLRYGPDADEDGKMDSIAEQRDFDFPQRGTPIEVTIAPRITYVIEVDQTRRGSGATLAPDPGLSAEDIRYVQEYSLILARIHNVGSKAVRNVRVAAYEGDPKAGGVLISEAVIPNIEAPNDLEPRAVTAGFHWIAAEEPKEIYIVVDPEDEITDEITTFNNVAHITLQHK